MLLGAERMLHAAVDAIHEARGVTATPREFPTDFCAKHPNRPSAIVNLTPCRKENAEAQGRKGLLQAMALLMNGTKSLIASWVHEGF